MTAFDGEGAKVSVFFDGPGKVIHVSLSDDPEDNRDGVVSLTPLEARLLREDLRVALGLRDEEPDLTTAESIGLWGRPPTEPIVQAFPQDDPEEAS